MRKLVIFKSLMLFLFLILRYYYYYFVIFSFSVFYICRNDIVDYYWNKTRLIIEPNTYDSVKNVGQPNIKIKTNIINTENNFVNHFFFFFVFYTHFAKLWMWKIENQKKNTKCSVLCVHFYIYFYNHRKYVKIFFT